MLTLNQKIKLDILSKKLYDEFKVFLKLIDKDHYEIYSSNLRNICSLVAKKSPICSHHQSHCVIENKKDRQVVISRCDAGFHTLSFPIIINDFFEASAILGPFKKEDFHVVESAIATNIDETEFTEFDDSIEFNETVFNRLYDAIDYIQPTIQTILENSYLEQMLDQYKLINKISKINAGSLDIQELLKMVVQEIVDYNLALNCALVLFDMKKRYAVKSVPDMYKDLEHDVIEQVKSANKIFILDNIESRLRLRLREQILCYKKMAGFPLIKGSELIGVLVLYYDDQINPKLIDIISDQIAIAIKNASLYTKTRDDAITDTLTGFYNRRAFMDFVEQEIEEHKKNTKNIAIVMTDIDHFGHYNNTNGHPAGDRLLMQMADLFRTTIGSNHIIARYGGEEFIIIFRNIEYSEAKQLADNLLKAVRNTKFEHEEKQPSGKLTISMGLFSSLDASCSSKEMIDLADQLLYKSKRNGRNQLNTAFKPGKNIGIIYE